MNFLSLSNLLQTHPSTTFPAVNVAISIVVIFFLGSFVFYHFKKKSNNAAFQKAFKKTPSLLRWYAGIMLVLTWARIAGVGYIAMRIWWVVLFLLIIYMIYRNYKKYKELGKRIEKYSGDAEKTKTVNKYLPKKKKKVII